MKPPHNLLQLTLRPEKMDLLECVDGILSSKPEVTVTSNPFLLPIYADDEVQLLTIDFPSRFTYQGIDLCMYPFCFICSLMNYFGPSYGNGMGENQDRSFPLYYIGSP